MVASQVTPDDANHQRCVVQKSWIQRNRCVYVVCMQLVCVCVNLLLAEIALLGSHELMEKKLNLM